MQWLNEPACWSSFSNQIIVNTLPKTDFWRVTHYGFIRDNGHFYFERINTDFIVEVEIRGSYKDLYDQAGITALPAVTRYTFLSLAYLLTSFHSLGCTS